MKTENEKQAKKLVAFVTTVILVFSVMTVAMPIVRAETDSIDASDVTETAGVEGTIEVTAYDEENDPVEDETIEVTDDDDLDGIGEGDTEETDDDGVAEFSFEENTVGEYTVEFDVEGNGVTDTATVTIDFAEGSLGFLDEYEDVGDEDLFGEALVENDIQTIDLGNILREETLDNYGDTTNDYIRFIPLDPEGDHLPEDETSNVTLHVPYQEDPIVVEDFGPLQDDDGRIILQVEDEWEEGDEFSWHHYTTGEYTFEITDYSGEDFEVNFEIESFEFAETRNLTLDVVGEGNVTVDDELIEDFPHEQEFKNGTEVELVAIPEEEESMFFKWMVDGERYHEELDNLTTEINITMDEDKTVEAHFAEFHNFTLNIEGEGNISVEQRWKEYMDEDEFEFEGYIEKDDLDDFPVLVPEIIESNLTANPAEGWGFIEWYDEMNEETYTTDEKIERLTVEEEMNLTARFGELYNLTVEEPDEIDGEVPYEAIMIEGQEITDWPYEEEFVNGTEVELEAVSAFGYEFDEWMVDGETYDSAMITIEMDENKTAQAHFVEAETHEVTFEIEDEDGEPIEGATVELESHETEEVEYSGDTDANGELVFDVVEGEYDYTITHDDYDDETGTIDVEAEVTETVTMSETLVTYTLSVENWDIDGVEEITVEGTTITDDPYDEDFDEGTEVDVELTVEDGYEFEEWDTEQDDLVDPIDEVTTTVTMDDDVTIDPQIEEVVVEVESIEIETQPILEYVEGDELDLSGMEVTKHYDDDTTEVVDFADFGDYDLEAEPEDGTEVTVADHDGETVTVTHTPSEETAETDPLTVEEKIVVEEFTVNDQTEDVQVEVEDELVIYAEVTNNMNEDAEMVVTVEDDDEVIHTWEETVPAGESEDIDHVYDPHPDVDWTGEYDVVLEVFDAEDESLHQESIDVEVYEEVETYELTLIIDGPGRTVNYELDPEAVEIVAIEDEDKWIFTLEEGTEVNLWVDEDDEDDFENWDLPDELIDEFDLNEESTEIEFTMNDDYEITANFEEDELDLMICAGVILIIIVIIAIVAYLMMGGKDEGEEEMAEIEEGFEDEEEDLFGEEAEEEEMDSEEEEDIFDEAEEIEEDLFEEEPED